MDTRFLESFIAVVELGSMAEAGRRLNLTATAVAQRIRALETELGVALLTRVGRTVRPTPAGSAVHARSRGLIDGVRDLRDLAALDVPQGELRIGAVSTALTGLLPAILTGMGARYPQIAFFVAPGTSIDLYGRVVSGDLDVALLVKPPFAIPKVCDWRVIRDEPLALLGWKGLDLSDPHRVIEREAFIRYDRNHWGGRLADDYLTRHGLVPRDRFELDALEAIAVMVDRGLGVSLIPDWAPPWPAGLSHEKRVIPDLAFARSIGLVWSRSSLRMRLIHLLVEEAVSVGRHSMVAGR